MGITGHQRLDDETAWPWVEATMRSTCRSFGRPLIGISSLAIGADQLFAKVVLELGGVLEVVIPFHDYAARFQTAAARLEYARLLTSASEVQTLAVAESDEHGYWAAGQAIARNCDVLLAVWDQRPSRGLGGTADVVQFAKSIHRRVIHLNPNSRTLEDGTA